MYSIIVVDDSPTIRQLMSFTLKKLPYSSISEAIDGLDAYKKIISKNFDMVITDINMPVMDGLKLVGLLRKDTRYKEIPIIIITTEDEIEERNKAMKLGATAYLPKPIKPPELIKMVNQFLNK